MRYTFLIFLITTTCLFAQKDERYKKIYALKTAHITEQLALTAKEAEKFWPIYNIYDSKMNGLRRKERTEIFVRLKNGVDAMTDMEADNLIDRALDIQTKELNYRKELIQNLRKVISPKKVIALRKAEEDFKRNLLKRYKGQRRHKND